MGYFASTGCNVTWRNARQAGTNGSKMRDIYIKHLTAVHAIVRVFAAEMNFFVTFLL